MLTNVKTRGTWGEVQLASLLEQMLHPGQYEANVAPVPGSADRVEVSEVARWLDEMNRLPAVREDRVAAARAAIANGNYDTDEKLSIALNRLIDDIG